MTESNDDSLRAARTTVEIFASIVGRPLVLKNGKTARTVKNDIVVPFADQDPYLLVERQLAHALFRSDAQARALFVEEFLRRTTQGAYNQDLPAVDFAEMRPTLERIVDILESRRIESLWGMLYPGSALRSRERLRRETEPLVPAAHESLFVLFVCLDAGHEVPPGPLDSMRGHLEEALLKVERRGFDATLTIARWLISRLVTQVQSDAFVEGDGSAEGKEAQGPPQDSAKQRLTALRDLSTVFGELPKSVEQRYSDYQGEPGGSPETEEAMKTALRLDLRDVGAVSATLDKSEGHMTAFLATVQNRLEVAKDRDDWLSSDPHCEVKFLDIAANDRPMTVAALSDNDVREVRRLRKVFGQIMSRRENRREDSGAEVDVHAFIERQLTGVPIPCFKAPQRARGFRALILVDRSLSMKGNRTAQAERGVRLILDALDFPFVDVSVWGFQGTDGEVLLTRFHPDVPSLDTENSVPVHGETPLHVALRAAVRDLGEGSEARHLIVLTDGAPMFTTKNRKPVAEKQLRLEVRDEVARARRSGINVTALLIGSRTRTKRVVNGEPRLVEELVFDVSEKHVEYMFGARRHWRYVDDQTFASDLVHALTQSFVAYLKDS